MSSFTSDPQNLKNTVMGFASSLIALAAANWQVIIPWVLGVAVACYSLYNQHLTAKINRKKLKEHDANQIDKD